MMKNTANNNASYVHIFCRFQRRLLTNKTPTFYDNRLSGFIVCWELEAKDVNISYFKIIQRSMHIKQAKLTLDCYNAKGNSQNS